MPCVFCGAQKVTKEHILPEWMQRLENNLAPSGYAQGTYSEEKGWDEIRFNSIPFSQTARVACRSCNNEWMSEMEQSTKPILAPLIQGRRKTLGKDRSSRLAIWAFKTALVFQHTHPRNLTVPTDHYTWLKNNGTPHPSAQVWIGASDKNSELFASYSHSKLTLRSPLAAEPGRLHKFYVAGLLIGQLFLVVMGDDLAPNFTPDSRLHRIWPFDRRVAWPPSTRISLHEARYWALPPEGRPAETNE